MNNHHQTTPCIGLDFDNTIVCYDQIFHKAALELSLIPHDTPISKEAVRDHLRKKNCEEDWTLLQGHVYGARMQEAKAFPGLFDFFQAAKTAGFQLVIISHKTKTPYLGPSYDLHQAALEWMKSQRFFDADVGNIKLENVFFELTKEDKLRRIATTGCHLFIDDLPEILSAADFPSSVQRVLFSSHHSNDSANDWLTASHWKEVLAITNNYFSSHGG